MPLQSLLSAAVPRIKHLSLIHIYERAKNLSPYGKFQNVFLSDQELEEIKHSVSNWKEYIERLSGYMASTGKQYRNHAATIINWSRQDNPPSQQRIYESEEYETL